MKARLIVWNILLSSLLVIFVFVGISHAATTFEPRKIIAGDSVASGGFGKSVAVYFTHTTTFDKYYAIIGADGIGKGAAYIFKYDGNNWKQKAKLAATDGKTDDKFGCSVAISGDYAIVGASEADYNTTIKDVGAAYIFKRNTDGTWTQQQKLMAKDYATSDKFGYSVSISGDYVIIGAYGDDDNGYWSGSAYIFKRNSTSWTQQAKLKPDDGAKYDYFGESVSISGDYAVIGAAWDDMTVGTSIHSNVGSAYVFKRNSTAWEQQAKLTADDGAIDDKFGRAVSISGSYIVVGAEGDDDEGTNSGSAYVFQRVSENWTQHSKLTADDGAKDDYFGGAVSLSGNYAVIGAKWDDDDGSSSGSAYLFALNNGTWLQQTKLTAGNDGSPSDKFGGAVSVFANSGEYAVITGAVGDDDDDDATMENSGSAYAYASATGDVPYISSIDDIVIPQNSSKTVSFTIEDTSVNISATSGNPSVISDANIVKVGSGTSRTLTITSGSTVGEAEIKVTVTNTSGTSAEETFTVTVTSAPVISGLTDEVTLSKNNTTIVDFTVSDADTSSVDIVVTASSSNETLIPNDSNIIPYQTVACYGTSCTYAISIIPETDEFGESTITITAGDGSGEAPATDSFIVKVIGGEPEISTINDDGVDEDGSDYVASFSIEDEDSSPTSITVKVTSDNDSLVSADNIKITNVTSNGGTISSQFATSTGGTASSHILTITPAENQNGEAVITVEADDGEHDTATVTTFTLTVNPVYDKPTIVYYDPDDTTMEHPLSDIPDQEVDEDKSIKVTIEVDDPDKVNTTEEDIEEWTLTIASTDVTVVPEENIQIEGVRASTKNLLKSDLETSIELTFTPSDDLLIPSDGEERTEISITVNDGTNNVTESFILIVKPQNDLPTIFDIEDQYQPEGTKVSIPFTVNDLDGDTLTISVTSTNTEAIPLNNIVIKGVDASNQVDTTPGEDEELTLEITTGQSGTSTITVTVNDGTGEAEDTFDFEVEYVNDPPTISQISSVIVKEGETSENIELTVNDPDGDWLTITATSSDTTVIPNTNIKIGGFATPYQVSPTTYVDSLNMTVEAPANQSGSVTITISVTDGEHTVTKTFGVNITPVNDAPVISGTPPTTADEDELYTFTPDLTDEDNVLADMTFSIENKPDWATFDTETGTLSGTPENEDVGTFSNIIITVKDPSGDTDSLSVFSIKVINVNDAPVITSDTVGGTTTPEDTNKTISFDIKDLEGGLMSISVTSQNTEVVSQDDLHIRVNGQGATSMVTVPANESPSENTLVLVPVDDASGSTMITITVTEQTATENQTATHIFYLTVNPSNDAPTIETISEQTTAEDTAKDISVTINDQDGGLLTIKATSTDQDVVPDANIKFTGTDAAGSFYSQAGIDTVLTMKIAPVADASGSTTITLTAADSDNEKSVPVAFLLTVTEVNDAPIIEDVSGTFTINEDEPTDNITFTVSDVDGGSIAVSVTSENTDVLPNSNDNIDIDGFGSSYVLDVDKDIPLETSLTLTPAENASGSARVIITLTDGSHTVTEDFYLTVKPVNDPPSIEPITPQDAKEGVAGEPVEIIVSDPEGGVVTVSVSSDDDTLVPNDDNNLDIDNYGTTRTITLEKDTPRTLELIITPESGGLADEVYITVTAKDNKGDMGETSFRLIFQNKNPVISEFMPASPVTNEDESVDVSFYLSDLEGGEMHILVESQNESLVPNDNSSINIVMDDNEYGNEYSLDLGENEEVPLILRLLPEQDQTGSARIVVTVTDGDDEVSEDFYLNVKPGNDAPVIEGLSDVILGVNETSVELEFTLIDIEGGNVDISVSSGKESLIPNGSSHISINGGGASLSTTLQEDTMELFTLKLTPVDGEWGTAPITVTVNDLGSGGDATSEKTFSFTVNYINQEPEIEVDYNQATDEDTPAEITLVIQDAEGGTMNVSVSSGKEALIPNTDDNIDINGYGTQYLLPLGENQAKEVPLTLTPVKNQTGTALITVTVEDEENDHVVSQKFQLKVNPTNDAPVISGIQNVEIEEDETAENIEIKVTDLEGDTLTISAEADDKTLVPDANIDIDGYGYSMTQTVSAGAENTFYLTLTPETGANGSTTIIVTAQDEDYETSQVSFLLTVGAVNDAPVISIDKKNWTLNEEETTVIPFAVSDTEGGTLEVSVSSDSSYGSSATIIPNDNAYINIEEEFGLNYFLTLSAGSEQTLNLSITPAEDQIGTAKIIITVEDGDQAVTEYFFATVKGVNDAPVISNISNQYTNDDEPKDVGFTVTDAEGGTMRITIDSLDEAMVPGDDEHIDLKIGGESFGTSYTGYIDTTAMDMVLNLTPVSGEYGSAEIEITVVDGGSDGIDVGDNDVTATRTFYFMNVNESPEISIDSYRVTNEDTPLSLTFSVSDEEGGSLGISVQPTKNADVIPNDGEHIDIEGFDGTDYLLDHPGGGSEPLTLTLTPAENEYGTVTLNITVTDGDYSVTETFQVRVDSVNDAPVISDFSGETIEEDAENVQGADFSISDVEGGSVEVVVSSLSPELIPDDDFHLSLNNSGTVYNMTLPPSSVGNNMILTVTPTEDAVGTATLKITVTENSEEAVTVERTFSIRITEENDKPRIFGLRNQSTEQDTPIEDIPFYISDPEGGNMTITVSSDNENLIPEDDEHLDISGNGYIHMMTLAAGVQDELLLTIRPESGKSGTATLTIEVDDGTGSDTSTATHSILVRVDEYENQAPTLSVASPTLMMREDETSATVNFTIQDLEGGALDISVSSSKTALVPEEYANINIIDNDNGLTFGPTAIVSVSPATPKTLILKLTPVFAENGESTITITVSDGIVDDVSKDIVLVVTSVNSQPVISDILAQEVNEDNTIDVSYTAEDDETAEQNLKITVDSSDESVVPDANIVASGYGSSRVLKITPAKNASGETIITVTVDDNSGESNSTVSDSFVLTVNPVNDAPTISSISTPKYIIVEDDTNLAVNFTVGDVETSADNLIITAVKTEDTNGIISQITRSGTGSSRTITITPTGQLGNATVEISVDDDSDISTASFTVISYSNTAADNPPTITGISSPQITNEDVEFPLTFTVSDTETPAASLEVFAESLRTDIVPNGNINIEGSGENRTLRLTPGLNKSGDATIRVTVDDGTYTTSVEFTLKVLAVNDAPVVTGVPSQITLKEDEGAVIDFTVEDVETVSQNLKVRVTSSNYALFPVTGIDLACSDANCASYTLSLTPVANTSGTAVISIKVTDESYDSNSTTIETCSITVGEVLPGDVDSNGFVELRDAVIALKILTGINTSVINTGADVNGDGKIGMAEVLYIMQYVSSGTLI